MGVSNARCWLSTDLVVCCNTWLIDRHTVDRLAYPMTSPYARRVEKYCYWTKTTVPEKRQLVIIESTTHFKNNLRILCMSSTNTNNLAWKHAKKHIRRSTAGARRWALQLSRCTQYHCCFRAAQLSLYNRDTPLYIYDTTSNKYSSAVETPYALDLHCMYRWVAGFISADKNSNRRCCTMDPAGREL